MTHGDILYLADEEKIEKRSYYVFKNKVLNVVLNPQEERIAFRIADFLLQGKYRVFMYSDVMTSIDELYGVYGGATRGDMLFVFNPYFEEDALGKMRSKLLDEGREKTDCIVIELDNISIEVVRFTHEFIFKGYIVILVSRKETEKAKALANVYIELDFQDEGKSVVFVPKNKKTGETQELSVRLILDSLSNIRVADFKGIMLS